VSLALGPPLRRVLDRLDAAGATLPVAELAQHLLALSAPVGDALARRLLASAFGCHAEQLPDLVSVRELPRIFEGPVAALPLAAAHFVVVDLETTGLSAEQCTILEIGAVRIRGLRAVDTFHTLIDPGTSIPPFITRLTGIDRSMVEGAPPLARAICDFHAWASAVPGAAFVAHNASFDARFVARAYADHALPPWSGPTFCTVRLARRVLPELARYDLDTLSAHFGISNRWRHRALGDAEAAARALLELIEIARDRHDVANVGDLVSLQAARRKRATRAKKPKAKAPALVAPI
jgi:DNA polymerase III epsilon subunit family exonuclease